MKLKQTISLILSAALGVSAMNIPAVSAEAESALADSGINYTESTETINNPGAGYTSTLWMSCEPGNTPVFNPTGNLMLILVDLGGFSSGSNGTTDEDGNYTEGTDYDLDEVFFTNLRATLDNCRRNGCTIALRFRYDDVGKLNPEPATYDKMLEHIYQIRDSGIFEDYKDIIAFVETGFVGSWGEHWGGKYCSFEDKARLLDILLDVVPEEIPVTVRTPMTFVTWAGIEEEQLGEYVSEPGSDASRVCLYNDGYMGSNSDLGTYHDRERDLKWVSRQAVTSYYGGEFSGNLEFTMQYDTYLPENAIPEMYQTHLSYINSNIYQLYKDYTFGAEYDVENVDNSAYYGETVFKFMRDHLGYRFVVRDSDLSAEVKQGGVLTLQADIENTGFANPLMEQKAEILLEKDGNYIRTEVDVDTETWYSRTTASPEFELKLPGGLETGEWNVYFKLSTGNNTLGEMHVRSVQFANEGTWNSALGANYMGTFTVTASDDDDKLRDGSFCQVNAVNEVTVSDGEMYTISNIAAADGYVGNDFECSDEIKYAEDDASGNKLYVTNDNEYLYVMAEVNHNAQSPVYNLKVKNETTGKNYWLYYQGNGFIYFNTGKPFGCVQKHYGNRVEFRVPLGELMGLEAGTVISNITVFIQDESDSWKNVGELNSGEYIVSDNFNIYSAKRTEYLSEGELADLTVRASRSDLLYQWTLNGEPIDGAVGAVFTADSSMEGICSVKLTSSDGAEKTVDICEIIAASEGNPMGDVNLDGDVNSADAVKLQRYLLRAETLTQAQLSSADMNGDGLADIFDMVLLRKALMM
ncbi:MAG: DUF4832 domain-containing protein [Ruminococcus sp.]|nr:DUF4832 domain-containing protein [Ruminococcus sp.]